MFGLLLMQYSSSNSTSYSTVQSLKNRPNFVKVLIARLCRLSQVCLSCLSLAPVDKGKHSSCRVEIKRMRLCKMQLSLLKKNENMRYVDVHWYSPCNLVSIRCSCKTCRDKVELKLLSRGTVIHLFLRLNLLLKDSF